MAGAGGSPARQPSANACETCSACRYGAVFRPSEPAPRLDIRRSLQTPTIHQSITLLPGVVFTGLIRSQCGSLWEEAFPYLRAGAYPEHVGLGAGGNRLALHPAY